MDVSIIIINYNTCQMTDECITSICNQTKYITYEIILVDNGSTDGSFEHFKDDERVKYIYSKKNVGFGRANNLGFKHSHGKYVFLLNSDTLLLNNAIYEFWNYMQLAPIDVACCGCQLLDINGKPTHSAGRFPDMHEFWKRIVSFVFYELLIGRQREPEFTQNAVVDYVTGADLFIRRDVILENGMFDPDFFMYYEETEMQKRFYNMGYKSMIIVTPKIQHLIGGSYKRKGHSLNGMIREMRSRYIYCRKVFNSRKKHIIAFMHLLMIPRVLICRASFVEKMELIKIIISEL